MNSPQPPSFADIEAAALRLAGVARRTPLLAGTPLDEVAGGTVLLKVESLQRTGSFKIRGAFNHLAQLDSARLRAGVVAYSSGNHAQGVAAAARLLNARATIVMPTDAPQSKLENVRALGADVIGYDRATGDREQIAAQLAAERGAVLVPPYDDPQVIAGQGTVGLELMQQAGELGHMPDQLLVCCGGGGLTAGSALAARTLSPSLRVYSVEPEGFDDHRRSLEAGKRLANPPGQKTICDALMAPMPGALTFAMNRELLAGGIAVSDADVLAAMRFAWRHLRLVVEPGGAVALAAVLAGKADSRGKTTAVVISGGNVDAAVYRSALQD